jgi:hypothetical protein
MTYELTPRADRIRVLRARRDQLDALIRRLEEGERQDGEPRSCRRQPVDEDFVRAIRKADNFNMSKAKR